MARSASMSARCCAGQVSSGRGERGRCGAGGRSRAFPRPRRGARFRGARSRGAGSRRDRAVGTPRGSGALGGQGPSLRCPAAEAWRAPGRAARRAPRATGAVEEKPPCSEPGCLSRLSECPRWCFCQFPGWAPLVFRQGAVPRARAVPRCVRTGGSRSGQRHAGGGADRERGLPKALRRKEQFPKGYRSFELLREAVGW